jgi:hypothetical protein
MRREALLSHDLNERGLQRAIQEASAPDNTQRLEQVEIRTSKQKLMYKVGKEKDRIFRSY